MSADFWAGYISGAIGIIIGNPLDLIKVRLQARQSNTGTPIVQKPALGKSPHPSPPACSPSLAFYRALVTGTAAPVLGYGALNALLFVSYNRSRALLDGASTPNLYTTYLAGALGGLATWVVSTPTELIKCRAQLADPSRSAAGGLSSWRIARNVLRHEGARGLYLGGAVTALRDSIGYGFYFWAYELANRWMESEIVQPPSTLDAASEPTFSQEAVKVLLCGGIAGVVTWASVFPLDVVKTRVQTQSLLYDAATEPLLGPMQSSIQTAPKRLETIEVVKHTYHEGGMRIFFRGLTVCSIRAFVVNAVQWATYEWIMLELGQGRRR
ncbi:mitochondrial carrier [Xylariaceae sp. FL0016]|nr:mitochondrial carrier [Xylariaceae sp. FL0016]